MGEAGAPGFVDAVGEEAGAVGEDAGVVGEDAGVVGEDAGVDAGAPPILGSTPMSASNANHSAPPPMCAPSPAASSILGFTRVRVKA